tara:strand:- start:1674 stop:1940 length:267 start_codon:yes stop_codon:yes gene_type:complete
MSDLIPPRRDEFLTRDGRPTQRFIEYLEALTRQTNTSATVASSVSDNSALRAQLKALQQQVGSGNPLTWDETGFTWDSTKHSFDQTEA